MSTIGEKHKLDLIGNRSRAVLTANIQADANRLATATTIKHSYASLIETLLETAPYVFITVNLDTASLGRTLITHDRRAGRKSDDVHILGREYYEARRSGVTYQVAMETLWEKFLHRLNKKVLGTHRYIRCKQYLRWIRVYENAGKRYAGSLVNHVHMLLEIPSSTERQIFEDQFRELFSLLIYPLNTASTVNPVLNIQQGRIDGPTPHTDYIQKQLINLDTASDRVLFSDVPGYRASDEAAGQRPIWRQPSGVLAPCNS